MGKYSKQFKDFTTTAPFVMVYNVHFPKAKWVVRTSNIGKKFFSNLFALERLETSKEYTIRLTQKQTIPEVKWNYKSTIQETDNIRQLTIKEYLELQYIFKKHNLIFNKKKNSLTYYE